jgi:Skp family chaperone for outer membrane proteins
MRKMKVALWLSGLSTLLLLGTLIGQQVVKAFKPPRTAVVDVTQVFEAYDKKRDRQDQFQIEIKDAEDKVKDIDKKVKDIAQEIQNLEPGKARTDKEFDKLKLEREIKDLKQSEMDRLHKKQGEYINEIRDEIEAEISAYAQAVDLDLVIEKTFLAEPGPEGSFRWRIVHFAKPEIEITTEIAERLNSRYRPLRAAAGPQVGPPAPSPGSPPGSAQPQPPNGTPKGAGKKP